MCRRAICSAPKMTPEDEDDAPLPPTGIHYAMQRVLGPAMGVVVFVLALVVFPVTLSGKPPPFSLAQLGALFIGASLVFWWWARRVDRRNDSA